MAFLGDNDLLEDAYLLEREAGDTADEKSSTTFSEFPDDLVLLLKTLLARKDEYKKLAVLEKKRETQLVVETAKVMAEVLKARVKEYKTSIAEDKELLQKESIQGRRRMAVEVRLGEKEVLQEAQAYASSLVLAAPPDAVAQNGPDEPNVKRRKVV